MSHLSVIVLTFEDSSSCIKTIRSCKSLTRAEFIVVDCNIELDLSLREELANLMPQFPIKYLDFGKSTIAQAMNHGLANATGRWVWFLNAGDTISEIDVTSFELDLNSEKDLLIGKTRVLSDRNEVKDWNFPGVNSRKFCYGMNTICHQSCIFDRRSLESWGGFPLIAHFDWLTIFHFTRQLNSELIASVVIDYQAGGKSSKENLISWGLSNLKIRREYRLLFGGNSLLDWTVYILYLQLRILANLFSSRRRRDWWRVGN